MALTTLARIRALAGFRPKHFSRDTIGTGNGVNIVFAPAKAAVFVSPTADAPQSTEIRVYVNDQSVGIASVSEEAVVLTEAPAAGSTVTADYWGHNLSNGEVNIVRQSIEAEVYGRLSSMYAYADLAKSPLIARIVAYLAAADLSDQAYNESGANTAGQAFPPDRLRRVGYNLLTEVSDGIIALTDADNADIPVVAEIDTWIEETSYPPDRPRLMEQDPFASPAFDRTSDYGWRWSDNAT